VTPPKAANLDLDALTGFDRSPAAVGRRLRTERERKGIGVRELSRRIGVSASLISQVELGKATPSVGTLYAFVQELDMTMDELFTGETSSRTGVHRGHDGPSAAVATGGPVTMPSNVAQLPIPGVPLDGSPLVRGDQRQSIHLGSGVTWQRMNPQTDPGVDFLYVIYDVGGASAPEQSLIRHSGREYGHLLEGLLGVTVGFETYELQPGDAISFDSAVPHRLFNMGDIPAKAIWTVIGRMDSRISPVEGQVRR
jgi:mannose-6-phosphate isomerase-like protein (cupin superfamily)/DNA-binding XRE family transcriptional regulator